jgi:prepilin-type processing-associated H-X9-DG protein
MYATENKGFLPPACMYWDGFWKVSWDDLLAVNLGVRYGGPTDPQALDLYGPYPGDQTGLDKMKNPPKVLKCPADNRDEFVPSYVKSYARDRVKRSYSMVRNEINNAAGNTVALGVGEWFIYNGNRSAAIPQFGAYNKDRRALKFTSIRNSSDVLMLVENFDQNACGNDLKAVVDCPADAVPNFLTPQHPGKANNFLYVDGHVQTAPFEETYPSSTSLPTDRPAKGSWQRK